jgi:hypothetical protein
VGLGREKLSGPGTTQSALGNWFVNVVPMGGREAFLFMSTRSLLSFPIMVGKLEPGPQDLAPFLNHGITMLIQSMKVPRSQARLLQQDLTEVAICSNLDKSLIGIHSAIANEYFQRLSEAGSGGTADISTVVAEANSTPRATLNWSNSFEVTRELLAASVA